MFLCFPIIFIISISEIRSDRSFSEASADGTAERSFQTACGRSSTRMAQHSPFNIFTATLLRRVGLLLSSPTASARTT